MRDTPFLVLTSVLIIAMSAGGAVLQSTAAGGRANTWTATTSTGATLSGTWTALYDPRATAVTGTWTLVNQKGAILARGGWSAVKSSSGWSGTWRANVAGGRREYSGGWSTAVDLGPGTAFGSLFEQAAEAVVSGRWRSGGQSGAWSIRAYK